MNLHYDDDVLFISCKIVNQWMRTKDFNAWTVNDRYLYLKKSTIFFQIKILSLIFFTNKCSKRRLIDLQYFVPEYTQSCLENFGCLNPTKKYMDKYML